MRTFVLIALCIAGAAAGAVELTEDNFAAEVTDSNKNAFIKPVYFSPQNTTKIAFCHGNGGTDLFNPLPSGSWRLGEGTASG
jgi:hypothetical protein